MIVGYHGCDRDIAEQLLAGEPFQKSENVYDWLGHGIYFCEFGRDRALRFAEVQKKRGKVKQPSVVGALIQLGNCFDLLDTFHARQLAEAYELLKDGLSGAGIPLPENKGGPPDRKVRMLDCAVVNFLMTGVDETIAPFQSVRAAFWEGGELYPGAGFQQESHIQVAVRDPACIVGVFRPTMETP